MDWLDEEALKRCVESYRSAMDDILSVAPKLELATNDYNCSPLPTSFRVAWGKVDHAVAATDMTTHNVSLFDFWRPLQINERSWVWTGYFMKVSVYRKIPFSRFLWEPGIARREAYTDEEGIDHAAIDAIPSALRERKFFVTLLLKERHWGLRDWWIKHEEIEHFMDGASDELSAVWVEAIHKADKEVARYEEAVSSMPLVPGKANSMTNA